MAQIIISLFSVFYLKRVIMRIIENIHIHQHLLKITNSFSAGSTHECALREKALAPDLSAFHAGALPLAS